VIRPKLEHAVKRGSTRGRIAARWSGVGHREGRCGLRPASFAETGRRGASREARKSGDLAGCSLREVSCRSRREASFAQRQGEPRGEPRGRAVAGLGGSIPDEGSFIESGERVRGRVQQTSSELDPRFTATARLRHLSRWKAS
jgi:hypothetical protein